MTVLKGHFNGTHVVLDEPVPPELKPNTQVSVVVGNRDAQSVLASIASLAVKGNLPPDFSQQHEQFVKGTPRR
jgi:hypothetical protein